MDRAGAVSESGRVGGRKGGKERRGLGRNGERDERKEEYLIPMVVTTAPECIPTVYRMTSPLTLSEE